MTDEIVDDKPTRSVPTYNKKTGLIEPTIADAMFLACTAPGYDGATGLNLLVWGNPGTGKTATAKDVINRSGLHARYVDLSLSAPEDLAGIPRVMFYQMSEDGKTLEIHYTTDTARKDKDGNPIDTGVLSVRAVDATWLNIASDPLSVLIVDDITNSVQMVQAALLRVALERQISDGQGGFLDLKHMAVLAMANFGDGNALQPLLGPLANRFSHIEASEADVMRWWNTSRTSQLTIDLDKATNIKRDFPALEKKYWDIVNTFIVEHQLAAFDIAPTEFNTVQQHAYASSRTYEFCIRWLAACEYYGVQPDRLVRASIGDHKGGMLISWLRTRELGLAAMNDTIEWEKLDVAECTQSSMWAARNFQTSEDLQHTIKSIERLAHLREKSHDNNVPARDYLIHRALGLPVGPNGQVD